MRKFLSFILILMLVFIGLIFWAKLPVSTKEAIANNAVVSLNFPQGEPDPETITLITYNLGYASAEKNNTKATLTKKEVLANLDTAAAVLKEENPDVICLQEVDFDASRTHHIDQLEYLARKLEMPFAAYAVNWSKKYLPYPYWPPSKHFGSIVSGQAILSRYPLKGHTITTFDKPPHEFWYNWFYIERLAERATVDLGGQNIALWNVHLEAFHKPTRLKQARDLAVLVAMDRAPHRVLAGDLNDPQAEEGAATTENAAFTLMAGAKMQGDAEFTHAFTYPSWKPAEKLDHVLISKDLIFAGFKTLKATASDHLPVMAQIRLK